MTARTVSRARRLATVLLPAAALVPLARTAAQSGTPPLNGGRLAAEVAVGALGTPIGFVAGGVLTKRVALAFGASDDAASSVAYAGAWTGAALGTAAGPRLIGARGPVTGSYWAAVAGAVTGGLGSFLLVRLNNRGPDDEPRACRVRCVVSTAAIFLLPSVGATVGFNLSRRYER
jgi:hypothetical protein